MAAGAIEQALTRTTVDVIERAAHAVLLEATAADIATAHTAFGLYER